MAETRTPLPTAPGRPARFDYEYERRGVSAVFMLCEPLRGWREVSISDHRGMVDFGHVIKHLVDEVNPGAEQIVLVMDQLNTHSPGSLYEAFELLRPSAWPTSSRSTTRPNTGAGSIWPKSN